MFIWRTSTFYQGYTSIAITQKEITVNMQPTFLNGQRVCPFFGLYDILYLYGFK